MNEPVASILLVEDDDGHRQALRRHFERSGHAVRAVDTGEAALATLESARPDLIITDVRMPGMSGLDLLDRVRANERAPPIVVMTAYGDMHGAIDAMRKGAWDYLVKPLDLDHLDTIVRRCLYETRTADGPAVVQPEPAPAAEYALIGHDPRMMEVYKTIGAIVDASTPVLVRGEPGTGRALVARVLHASGSRAAEPFVAVDCTLPGATLDVELFGHVRGAFADAVTDRRGRIEQAGAGTLFLDEVGDTAPATQGRLLRLLQDGEFHPLGGDTPGRSRARIVASTHRDLEQLVDEGRFREDLYLRLRVVELRIPPLRERAGDVPLIARHFLGRLGARGGRVPALSRDAVTALVDHTWPGNVRELENVLTRAAVLARGAVITGDHIDLGPPGPDSPALADDGDDSLEAVERAHVQRVLSRMGGNKSRTAEALGISRPRLDRLIERYGLII